MVNMGSETGGKVVVVVIPEIFTFIFLFPGEF
jgi:hypothetical protein